MIMLCNYKYSRSLKLRPDHNRVAQWNSMGNRLFIFFSPQCFMQDLLIAYALWHLIDYFRQISVHHSNLQKPGFIYTHLQNCELLPESCGLEILQSASLAHHEASLSLGGVTRWSWSALSCYFRVHISRYKQDFSLGRNSMLLIFFRTTVARGKEAAYLV